MKSKLILSEMELNHHGYSRLDDHVQPIVNNLGDGSLLKESEIGIASC